MNAQEAIERMEKRLAALRKRLNLFEGVSYRTERDRLLLEIEALSICLESAKLFHEKVIPMFENDHAAISPSAKPRSMFGVPLEKLGIEGEADE